MENKNVYQLISEVSTELAKEGIAKGETNQQQGWKFRGIDQVLNTLSPLLSKAGLVILPRVLQRTCVERVSNKGGALFYVTVDSEFDFVSSFDGSKHTVRVFGEAMDSGDKATNKAMSIAYKYAAIQTFCIPIEGEEDPDLTSHDITPSVPTPSFATHKFTPPSAPKGLCKKCNAPTKAKLDGSGEYCSKLCWKNPKPVTQPQSDVQDVVDEIPF